MKKKPSKNIQKQDKGDLIVSVAIIILIGLVLLFGAFYIQR